MKELINLIVNTLGMMGQNEDVKISKVSPTEYKFSGTSKDDSGAPYGYEISVKYMPVQMQAPTQEQLDVMQNMTNDMIKKIADAVKADLKKEDNMLNENKEEPKDGDDK